MNFDPLQPLDAPEEAKFRRPPTEHRMYLVFFVLQYLLLFIGFVNDNMGGIFWLVISLFLAGILQIVIGLLQIISAILCLAQRYEQRRRLYLMMAGANLLLILLFILSPTFLGEVAGSVGLILSLSILPHALAWYYWYISYRETK